MSASNESTRKLHSTSCNEGRIKKPICTQATNAKLNQYHSMQKSKMFNAVLGRSSFKPLSINQLSIMLCDKLLEVSAGHLSTNLNPKCAAAESKVGSSTRRKMWQRISAGTLPSSWLPPVAMSSLAVANKGNMASGMYVTSVPMITSNPLLLTTSFMLSMWSLFPHSNLFVVSLVSNDGSMLDATFLARRSSAKPSPSVATTRSASLAAIIEQIPPLPHPNSNILFPATMLGFSARTEAINRADSHSIKPVDLQVCWYSFESKLILKFQPLRLISMIYRKNSGDEKWTH